MSKIKPISPDQIDTSIPDFVIQAVNNLLKENYRGGEVSIKVKDIIAEGKRIGGSDAQVDWYKKKFMDFEKLFRKSGWAVTYSQPSYGDSDFDSFYRFNKK